ncbi:hypothetical protein LOTGIDRAFT_171971 [Lottia gigantea]|uniref:Uncharacterized protein n=1 Tax=Lottia gigantea TaxID=225164 RepID=V4AEQ1_LOTGI|nr:hypothetical protein LOTGIDRAFT_171971 [Lottia gigantea]ESP02499.1 hypothetical protein LOTGIDRAFT_171971 [Lottia gigantea]
MDRFKFGKFQDLEQDVSKKLSELKRVMFMEVDARIQQQTDAIDDLSNQTTIVLTQKDFLYRFQLYMIEKNFMRVRDAMEERTFNFLALGFQEYVYQIETKIRQIMDPEYQDPQTRQILYLLTLNQLNGRIDLAERAFNNYTQLYDSYLTGNAVFRYKFESEHRDNNYYINPKPLLAKSLNHSSYSSKYSSRVGDDINLFKQKLQNLSQILQWAYFNNTLNETELHLAGVMFIYSGRRLFHSKSTFYYESVDYPKRILEQRIADFKVLWRQYENTVNSMRQDLYVLRQSLEELKSSLFQELEIGLSLASHFFQYGNLSKMEVAEEMTSDKVYEGISNFKVFFQNIRSRGQSVFDSWASLSKMTSSIWDAVIYDEDMVSYYQYKNMSDYLRNSGDVRNETERLYSNISMINDFRVPVGNSDSVFLKSLDDFMVYLKTYIDGDKIDSTFIRENFLQLDIFYREKSYEEITQQRAYDNFALFCDFGGSMGLFVGASVLTVFELLDLIIQQILQRVNKV